MQEEVTERIEREELLTLLDHSSRGDAQRITARIPKTTLDELLQPEQPPGDYMAITFREPRIEEAKAPMQHFVIAVSFAATLALGVVVLVLL